MIILEATNETLEIATSTTSPIDVVVSYADDNGTTLTAGSQETAITTATTTVIVSAPAASTQRQVKLITIENKGTTSNAITIKKDVGGTEYVMRTLTLKPGESSVFTQGDGFTKYAANGEIATQNTTDKAAPITAQTLNYLKVGAAMEAAGIMHLQYAATGFPGVWAPGTPGLNGRATDGTAAADAGCLPIKNPVSGKNYLTSWFGSATVACAKLWTDIMWINSGLVVTTTTAQAITPVALPARDLNETANGLDVMAGLLVTAATTNAGAVTNCTISYTDSDGNAGATGTMASFPATAVAGTLVPFQLAAGDVGVRSVQSVTLGTSLVTGSVSLVLFRLIGGIPVLLANVGAVIPQGQSNSKTKLANNICLLPVQIPTAVTATTLTGAVTIEEY